VPVVGPGGIGGFQAGPGGLVHAGSCGWFHAGSCEEDHAGSGEGASREGFGGASQVGFGGVPASQPRVGFHEGEAALSVRGAAGYPGEEPDSGRAQG